MFKELTSTLGFLLVVAVPTLLLYQTKISDEVYAGLFLLAVLCGISVYFQEKIKELDFGKGRILLHEVQSRINEATLKNIELMASLSTYSSGTWQNRKKLNDEIEELLDREGVEEERKASILRLPRLAEKAMRDLRSLTPEENQEWLALFRMD